MAKSFCPDCGRKVRYSIGEKTVYVCQECRSKIRCTDCGGFMSSLHKRLDCNKKNSLGVSA